MGGPEVPIIPTLSYWDNDFEVVRGEEHLRVVLFREEGLPRGPLQPAASQR